MYIQGVKVDKTVSTRDDVIPREDLEVRPVAKSNLVISKVQCFSNIIFYFQYRRKNKSCCKWFKFQFFLFWWHLKNWWDMAFLHVFLNVLIFTHLSAYVAALAIWISPKSGSRGLWILQRKTGLKKNIRYIFLIKPCLLQLCQMPVYILSLLCKFICCLM